MKNIQYMGAIALVGMGILSTSVFADNGYTSGYQMHPGARGTMMRQSGEQRSLSGYLRTDLTDAEKTALATLIQNHMDAIKALLQSASGSTNPADLQTQMKALQDQYITSLLPYIATDKQAAFQQAFAAMPMGPRGGADKGPEMNSGSMANFEANITRTVINVANGAQITETTTDSGTLARLQAIYNQGQNQAMPPNSTITVVRTMLSNGLQTLITSTDAAIVTKIQTQAADSKSGFGVGLGYFNKWQGTDHNGNAAGSGAMNRGMKSAPQASSSSLLPTGLSALIDTKLTAFATSDAKIAWLNSINTKIDALTAKVTAQKSKDILAALKDLLNQKIDALNGSTIDSSTLNNLLQ